VGKSSENTNSYCFEQTSHRSKKEKIEFAPGHGWNKKKFKEKRRGEKSAGTNKGDGKGKTCGEQKKKKRHVGQDIQENDSGKGPPNLQGKKRGPA